MNRASAFVFVFLMVGCSDFSVPGEAQIGCENDDDCPNDFFCRAGFERCVANADRDAPPIAFVEDLLLDPLVVSLQDGFSTTTVSFELNEAPLEIEVRLGSEVLECPAEAGVRFRCEIDAQTAALPGGPVSVSVAARDRFGNLTTADAQLIVDVEGPELISDPLVLYVPGAFIANPTPSAASLGVSALITFVTDELLAAPPVLSAVNADISIEAYEEGQLGATARVDVLDETAEGPLAITFDLVDDVGNRSFIEVADLVLVDKSAPVLASDLVVSRMLAEESSVIEGVSEEGEGALVLARLGSGFVVGTAAIAADGTFATAALALDLDDVFVSVVDAAGNEGPRAQARDFRLVIEESFADSGVLGEARSLAAGERFVNNTPANNLSGPATVENGSVSSTSALVFRELTRETNAAADRFLGGMVFDASRGRMVVHGGSHFQNSFDDTFEIVDQRWRVLGTLDKPPPGSAELVYDAALERVVAIIRSAETWVLDDDNWSFLVDLPAGAFGTPVYDEVRKRVVLTTGGQVFSLNGDEWVEDVFEPGPGSRNRPALAFSRAHGGIILYGGGVGLDLLSDIWLLTETGWTLAGDGGVGDDAVGIAADPKSGRVFIAGGQCVFNPCANPPGEDLNLGGVRELAGDVPNLSFVPVLDEQGAPVSFGINLFDQALAFDPVRDELLWLSGRDPGLAFAGETPAWSSMDANGRVTDLMPNLIGTLRQSGVGVVDPVNEEVLFVSGVFAGGDFVEPLASVSAVVPTLRDIDPLFSANQNPPFFDGTALRGPAPFDGEIFRRVGDAWVSEPIPANFPEAVDFAFHETLGAAIGFGNDDFLAGDTTFSFSSNTISVVDVNTTPPARGNAFTTYDKANERVILYGGFGNDGTLVDTWSFDGSDWTQLDDDGPGGAGDLFFHDSRGRPILLTLNGLFELGDSGWVALPVRGVFENANFAYDPFNDRLLAQGGVDPVIFTTRGELFEWDNVERPSLVYTLDLSALGADRTAQFTALEFSARLRADGFGEQAPEAFIFDGLNLIPVALTLGANNSASVDVTLDAALLERLPKRTLALVFAGRSAGDGGPNAERATVHLDALALTFAYTQP